MALYDQVNAGIDTEADRPHLGDSFSLCEDVIGAIQSSGGSSESSVAHELLLLLNSPHVKVRRHRRGFSNRHSPQNAPREPRSSAHCLALTAEIFYLDAYSFAANTIVQFRKNAVECLKVCQQIDQLQV
ncbi:unnamed protein product [Soboliphyme baturini]|uniref:GIT1_C domain-containing protein n=1 Tax=Soboliphyme baturini TaxID=241478 RepID=A0A183IM91_9BILA|nr:unnamed protein product [Soboliphyme baturini]